MCCAATPGASVFRRAEPGERELRNRIRRAGGYICGHAFMRMQQWPSDRRSSCFVLDFTFIGPPKRKAPPISPAAYECFGERRRTRAKSKKRHVAMALLPRLKKRCGCPLVCHTSPLQSMQRIDRLQAGCLRRRIAAKQHADDRAKSNRGKADPPIDPHRRSRNKAVDSYCAEG